MCLADPRALIALNGTRMTSRLAVSLHAVGVAISVDLVVSGGRRSTSAAPAPAVVVVCSELVLTGNRLGPDCCAAVGRALPRLPMLKKLALDACFIDDAAAQALAKAWPRGPAGKHVPCEISRLAIGGNALSPAGIAALAQCFACCRKLEEVDVSCTPLAAELPAHVTSTGHGELSQYDNYAWLDHGHSAQEEARTGGMLVWHAPMVQALAPLLRATHCVRSYGCVWTAAALRELLSFVNCNPSLQLLSLRQSELSGDLRSPAEADVTLSHFFRNLHARAETTAGAAAMLSLDVVGVPAGSMARVEKDAAAVVRSIANLNLACPEIDATSKAAPTQVRCGAAQHTHLPPGLWRDSPMISRPPSRGPLRFCWRAA